MEGDIGLNGTDVLTIENGEALGQYRVIALTTDEVAHITLITQQSLTITEAPLAGGWSAVADPDHDADTRRAAEAMLAQLPAPHAALTQVETAVRQVVAGMNYRLTLRLTDGQRWTALVWRKLDGTYQLSQPAQVQ